VAKLVPEMTQVTIDQAMAIAAKHEQAGRLAEAESVYQRILAVLPDRDDAMHALGMVVGRVGRIDQAVELLRRSIAAAPDNAAYYCNLGSVLQNAGRLDEAMGCYQRAVELKSDLAEAHSNMGSLWMVRRQPDLAVVCFQRALALKPDLTEAHRNLGNAWYDKGETDKAIASYKRALALDPNLAEIQVNLGVAWRDKEELEKAGECFQKALAINPRMAQAQVNLGIVWADQGQIDEAIACYRRALEFDPACITAHDNLIAMLHYLPDSDRRRIHEESRRWNQRHAQPPRALIRPCTNDRDPERRLRVGYVSPDFRGHPAGRFMLPLLASHDRHVVEVYCYASVAAPDKMTATLRSHVDCWRDIFGLPDEQVAQTIRNDQIDILVDLAMHAAGNRLLVFARKPAPVQVTYLAYAGGTALDAIDYRLTDRYLDPDDADDRFYMEKSIRLPGTYWCYGQDAAAAPVNELPALKAGRITLGCLNKFPKVSLVALETWAKLLNELDGARLLLHVIAGSSPSRVIQFMADRGIAEDRLEIVGRVSFDEYFKTYHRIDIALDPFPYAGGATTCDALWMGVPVVTLAGRTAVGRAGVSILFHAGLAELIANATDEYVRIAANLAADRPRLAELRATLRQRMQASPLMDAARFARNIEAAYRAMWRTWCQR
jgi:predicted O-linked N-acetylglucosamine transferase (SPINDLY family)